MPCVIRPLVSIFLLLAIASVAIPRLSNLSQRADAAMQSRIAGLVDGHGRRARPNDALACGC